MLYLVSLGLWDNQDISLKALDVMKKCDRIIVEKYTCKTEHSIKELEKEIGKKIEVWEREKIEGKVKEIIEESKRKDIVIGAMGDVLCATTHHTFIIEGRKQKVKVKVVHGSSIFTAISKVGLSLYKYGIYVSLPSPSFFPSYPSSPFEKIERNRQNGMHTLVLLDIGMRCYDALNILEKNLKKGKKEKVVCCYALGSKKEEIIYGEISKIKDKTKRWDDVAQCIIVPSFPLAFYEEEILKIWEKETNKKVNRYLSRSQ